MTFKFNGGAGALVCDCCHRIFKEPTRGTQEDEHYCPTCEERTNTLIDIRHLIEKRRLEWVHIEPAEQALRALGDEIDIMISARKSE